MRISISNIAWDPDQDDAVSLLLRSYGVDAIDVAPSKYVHNFACLDRKLLAKTRTWWEHRGIQIMGMQALLFGTSGLNVFNRDSHDAMFEHFARVFEIGRRLGAALLVFGSPKNRDKGDLSDTDADSLAVPFFQRIGDMAERENITVCLEPNPRLYHCNFMTNSMETASIVKKVNHSNIKMQWDTGSVFINDEDPDVALRALHPYIAHVHASEPGLGVLGTSTFDHKYMGGLIEKWIPDKVVTIEMLTHKKEERLENIEQAVIHAFTCYRRHAKGVSCEVGI